LHEMTEIDHGLTQRLTLLVYNDIEAVHDHLVAVFGFGPGTITRDGSGRAVHGELHVGDGVIWMHPASEEWKLMSPASLGGASTHCMAVMVDDVDRHHERAVAAGAAVVYPPRNQPYGFREYAVRDLEGGLWSFMTPLGSEET
jgi:MerR family transcriptional regulator, thiopeptide resistance regulator